MGEDHPEEKKKKTEAAADFHFPLWKWPLLAFPLMWSASSDLERILLEPSIGGGGGYEFCNDGNRSQVLGKPSNKETLCNDHS